MPIKRHCANCGKPLRKEEIAANWNDVWFACFPCWDKSEGFLGWLDRKPKAITAEHYPALVAIWDNDSDEVFNELGGSHG